jgi:hypothetical protein
LLEVIFAPLERPQWIEWCQGERIMLAIFYPQNFHFIPQMDLEVSETQISKLRLPTKMGSASQFLLFFHPKSTKIDGKIYNDSI